jgi:hypothetical protein
MLSSPKSPSRKKWSPDFSQKYLNSEAALFPEAGTTTHLQVQNNFLILSFVSNL